MKQKKKSSLNKRKERQQPCLHNQNMYFKRTKTTNQLENWKQKKTKNKNKQAKQNIS